MFFFIKQCFFFSLLKSDLSGSHIVFRNMSAQEWKCHPKKWEVIRSSLSISMILPCCSVSSHELLRCHTKAFIIRQKNKCSVRITAFLWTSSIIRRCKRPYLGHIGLCFLVNKTLSFFPPCRQLWAPCFAVRRSAWCSSFFSQDPPTIVSASWENSAWLNSEMWAKSILG